MTKASIVQVVTKLENFWRRFVLLNLPENEVFPFELFRWRKHVDSFEQFTATVFKYLGKTDIYVSINPPGLRNRGRMYRIVFDIDSDDLGKALEVTSDFVCRLWKKFRCRPLVVFTGRKGFQVHILLNKTVYLPGNPDAAYRCVCEEVLKRLYGSLRNVPREIDRHVFNYRALCRLPYTVHTGSRNISFIVQDLENFSPVKGFGDAKIPDANIVDEALRSSERIVNFVYRIVRRNTPLEVVRFDRKAQLLESALVIISRREQKPKTEAGKEKHGNVTPPPCIERIMRRLREGENLEHWERFFLVTWLHHRWGWNVDKICELFRTQPDYKPKITRYQVEHILGLRGSKKVYYVPSCRWVKEHGGCPSSCGRLYP